MTGQSGLGKSELALELISRGHSLVADDAVELHRTAPELLEGRCPPMLRDFLEVRGLGILNIRHIFGETSIRPKKSLNLIINLVAADDDYMKQIDRLSIRSETESILKRQCPLRYPPRGCRPQLGGAGGSGGTELYPPAARKRQHEGIFRTASKYMKEQEVGHEKSS